MLSYLPVNICVCILLRTLFVQTGYIISTFIYTMQTVGCLVCVHICVQDAWLWMTIYREGGIYAYNAIRLKVAFYKMSYCTFNV